MRRWIPITRKLRSRQRCSGIAAARAAGARVIGLTTMLAAGDLTGADATIPDFSAIRVRQDRDGFVVTTKI